MSGEFLIEKRPATASIFCIDGSVKHGTIYIIGGPTVPPENAQSIADWADGAEPFFPFHDRDGHFFLVGKACAAAVHVAEPLRDDPGYWTRVAMELTVLGGHHLGGNYVCEAGASMRLSDALNGHETWMRLERLSGVTWVRKASVITARFAD